MGARGNLWKNFANALRGVMISLRQERIFRLLLAVGVTVFALSMLLPLSSLERAVVWLTVAFILVLEQINSQFERVLDLLHPEHHQKVGHIKDIMAGAVLLASLAAALIGFVIFRQYI